MKQNGRLIIIINKEVKKTFKEYNQRKLHDTRWSFQEDGYDSEQIEKVIVDTLNEIVGKKGAKHIYPELKRKDAHLGDFLNV